MPSREWNNFTLCGVGRGTVDRLHPVHKGADDSIEFFGGTVNVKHLVLTQNEDDGLDTDNGWQGKAQFVVIQHVAPARHRRVERLRVGQPRHARRRTRAVPRTLPLVYNVTSIGKKDYTSAASFGALFRRGTGGTYYNHIIMKWPNGAVEVRDADTMDQITANMLFIKNSIFFDNMGADGNWPAPMATGDIDEKTIFTERGLDATARSIRCSAIATQPDGAELQAGDRLARAHRRRDAAERRLLRHVRDVRRRGRRDDWTAGWTAYPQN